jgi:hypothetical protein
MGLRLLGRTVEEKLRFNVAYDAQTKCWIWSGTKTGNGYGSIRLNGSSAPVHRVAYELWIGPLTCEDTVDHKRQCRRALCINPAHLEAVSGPENTRRMHEAIREAGRAQAFPEADRCGTGRGGRQSRVVCEMPRSWHRTHRVPGSHLHHGRSSSGRWFTWED